MSVVGNQLLLENLETVGHNLGLESFGELALSRLVLLKVGLDKLIEHIVDLETNQPDVQDHGPRWLKQERVLPFNKNK